MAPPTIAGSVSMSQLNRPCGAMPDHVSTSAAATSIATCRGCVRVLSRVVIVTETMGRGSIVLFIFIEHHRQLRLFAVDHPRQLAALDHRPPLAAAAGGFVAGGVDAALGALAGLDG